MDIFASVLLFAILVTLGLFAVGSMIQTIFMEATATPKDPNTKHRHQHMKATKK